MDLPIWRFGNCKNCTVASGERVPAHAIQVGRTIEERQLRGPGPDMRRTTIWQCQECGALYTRTEESGISGHDPMRDEKIWY